MTAEVLAYNSNLHVLSYLRGTFQWETDGSISAEFDTLGLPALDYLTDQDSGVRSFTKVRQSARSIWLCNGEHRGNSSNSVHSEVQSAGEQQSTAALPLQRLPRVQRPRTGPHRPVLPRPGSLDQVCLQELVPLWTLVIFFSCYAVVRLLLAVKQLGQGYTQNEGFSLRQGLRMLAYHVSEEGRM